jgi:hypothetical protein
MPATHTARDTPGSQILEVSQALLQGGAERYRRYTPAQQHKSQKFIIIIINKQHHHHHHHKASNSTPRARRTMDTTTHQKARANTHLNKSFSSNTYCRSPPPPPPIGAAFVNLMNLTTIIHLNPHTPTPNPQSPAPNPKPVKVIMHIRRFRLLHRHHQQHNARAHLQQGGGVVKVLQKDFWWRLGGAWHKK